MKRFVALATVVALAMAGIVATTAATSESKTNTKQSNPPEARCLLPSFEVFAAKVWAPRRWQRGAPPGATIAAAHRRIGCAPSPAHRHAMKAIWRADRRAFEKRGHYCRSGPVFAGRISTFSGGLTAGGFQATEPGIALRSSSTLGATFRLKTDNGTDLVLQTDWGPASWTGREIDITEAEASRLGGVVTDTWGEARMIPTGCVSAKT